MNILAIHLGHDGAVSIVKDNQLIVHQQIDRFSKMKHRYEVEFSLVKKIKELDIEFDNIHFTNINLDDSDLFGWVSLLTLLNIIKKDRDDQVTIDKKDALHHIYHAAKAVSFSKTNNIDIFVSDGNGAKIPLTKKQGFHYGSERVSIYNFNDALVEKFKYLYIEQASEVLENKKLFSYKHLGIGKAYEWVCKEYGWQTGGEEGKLMALSQYGEYNKKLYEKFCYENNFNLNNLSHLIVGGINDWRIEKNLNTNKFNKYAQDNAYNFQKVCEDITFNYVLKHIYTDIFCVTGGVNQNILINTLLSKKTNKEVLVDPIGNDQGISLGVCLLKTNFNLEMPSEVYLGFVPEYNLEIFDSNFFDVVPCNDEYATEILLNEPIAIFQGRSEQGQRGLGNRSLLMNPVHKECITKMNLIKKREWYRPFACSILEEKLNDWFVVDNNRNPNYMMFTFQARQSVKEELKNVTANDGSCRLQAVNKNINRNYYKLIKSFCDKTNIPLVLNTSLNLPGHTLVETLEDLKYMMLNSNLKYAYLPERRKMIIKYDTKKI